MIRTDVSSWFFSLNPIILYSTSLAVWTIIKVGLEIAFGILNWLCYFYEFLIFANRFSSVDETEQLSSNWHKIPPGCPSIKSITGLLSLNSI